MGLKLDSRIPYGNARRISITDSSEQPEVAFAAEPHRGPECLWFCFRLVDTSTESDKARKVKLVLKYFQNLTGSDDPRTCRPVLRNSDQNWMRMKPGKLEIGPDGQVSVTWSIDYPTKYTDIAFCYPYGRQEVENLWKKSRKYWRSDTIGLNQKGRPLERLSNDYGGADCKRPGLYLIARQHPGETPGSWVLDGILQQLMRVRNNPCLVWALPLADIDGILSGDYGRGGDQYEMSNSWRLPAKRHETRVYQQDIERWKARCRPLLAIDFQAPGACETEGVHCRIKRARDNPESDKIAHKWANIFKDALLPEFAAADFERVTSEETSSQASDFASFFNQRLGICALTIMVPYAMAGTHLLTCKSYREVGKSIANAIIKRVR